MNILEMKPILPGEVMKLLEEYEKERDLTYIEDRLLKFLKNTRNIDYENEKRLYEELKSVNIPEDIRIKIVEMLPKNEEELKTILYTYTLSRNEIEKILSIVKKYI
ncbi:MAG: hypothetical protein QXR54_01865 [Nanopusillaceae archaeon]